MLITACRCFLFSAAVLATVAAPVRKDPLQAVTSVHETAQVCKQMEPQHFIATQDSADLNILAILP